MAVAGSILVLRGKTPAERCRCFCEASRYGDRVLRVAAVEQDDVWGLSGRKGDFGELGRGRRPPVSARCRPAALSLSMDRENVVLTEGGYAQVREGAVGAELDTHRL